MIDPRKLFRAFYQTLYWFLGNATFGMLTIILLLFIKSLMSAGHAKPDQRPADPGQAQISMIAAKQEEVDEEIYNLLKSGIIIFFAISLMGSITIDLIISCKLDTIQTSHKLIVRFILIQMPFIILFSLITTYLMIVFKALPKEFLMLHSFYSLFVIGYSAAYCFIYKMYNFAK